MRLFSTHDEAVFDYIAFRRDIEGIAVERAARPGRTPTSRSWTPSSARWRRRRRGGSRGGGRARRQFHMAIIEASHNVVMLHMMRGMFDLLAEGVFFNRASCSSSARPARCCWTSTGRSTTRSSGATRRARGRRRWRISTSSSEALIAQRKAERNEEIARLRFAHEQER
jgi:GntR family transcriptional regulator, transcriptional repressor for pyruvate dehydrogenase complex